MTCPALSPKNTSDLHSQTAEEDFEDLQEWMVSREALERPVHEVEQEQLKRTLENELSGGKYTNIIKSVLDARKILPASEAGLVEEGGPVGSHENSATLMGDKFGQFAGARVSQVNLGDAPRGFAESDSARQELDNDMAALIEAGDIKMTEPDEDPSKVNLFKANGEPFRGVIPRESGQPVIEPTLIAG